MRSFFMFAVVMVVFSFASISEASIPSNKERINEMEVGEVDQVQELLQEYLERRQIEKKDLEGVKTGEDFYHKIVERLYELRETAEFFGADNLVIVVFEDVPEKVWIELDPFLEVEEKITLAPVIYAPAPYYEILSISEMGDDYVVMDVDSEQVAEYSQLLEAFCFVLEP